MKRLTRLRDSQEGLVLFNIIIVLMVIGLIGATLASLYLTVNLSSRLISHQVKAFYLAEAGVSYAVNILRNQAGHARDLKEKIGPISLGEGSFTIELDYNRSLITSIGSVQGIERKLQLKYSQL